MIPIVKVATVFLVVFVLISSCNKKEKKVITDAPLHIVFVTGDEEYRSEESMPMLARILKRELGAEISICYALDSLGDINPNINNNVVGLEALASADLAVFFLRWRALPDNQLKHIVDYVESGRPFVGFRTSTHTFLYKEDSSLMHLNNEWPTKVFGQQWITHHGHFEDGHDPLTTVSLINDKRKHKILNGVTPFDAYSWLYHVAGGDWKLYGDSDPLLIGTSLRSNHEAEGRLEQFPLSNPVAWTKSYTGTSGIKSRVFFTTLGHPFDFKLSPMRTLALNGIYWALGKENDIPDDGINSKLVGTYEPNNSGFGQKFKLNQRPVVID